MKSALFFRRLFVAVFAAALWIFAGTACVTNTTGAGSGSYVVTMDDGRVYRSVAEPILNPKTGYYQFRDRYGRDRVLRGTEVAKMEFDEE